MSDQLTVYIDTTFQVALDEEGKRLVEAAHAADGGDFAAENALCEYLARKLNDARVIDPDQLMWWDSDKGLAA